MTNTPRRATNIAVELADKLAKGSVNDEELKKIIDRYIEASNADTATNDMIGHSDETGRAFGSQRLQIMGALSSSNDGYPRGIAAALISTIHMDNPAIEQIVIVSDFNSEPFGISLALWEPNSAADVEEALVNGDPVTLGIDARADITNVFAELSQADDWGERDFLIQLDTGEGIALKTCSDTTENPGKEKSAFIRGFIDGLKVICERPSHR